MNTNFFNQICNVRYSKREFLGIAAAALPGCFIGFGNAVAAPATFVAIPENRNDTVTVPENYEWHKLVSWGDPLFEGMEAGKVQRGAPFTFTRSEQEKRVGTANDMFALFPKNYTFPWQQGTQSDWIMCSNNESTAAYITIPSNNGRFLPNPTEAEAMYAAMGVTIMELTHDSATGAWTPKLCKQGEGLNRRITPFSEVIFEGPAKNHPWIVEAARATNENEARLGKHPKNAKGVLCGTLQNCAGGFTPWGTYLTAEENFNSMFFVSDPASEHLRHAKHENGYEFDERSFGLGNRWPFAAPDQFDLARNPHGAAQYGWIVEIDPYDPNWTPRKRTALGRKKNECATCVITKSGQIATYSGDDESNEFVYKFVTTGKFNPNNRTANRSLLDNGKLYAARFEADGTGRWIEITLAAANAAPRNSGESAFANIGDLKVRNREAARRLGATQMDRPEDVECPKDEAFRGKGSVYVVCTGNDSDQGLAGNAANPRRINGGAQEKNYTGHIVRIHEKDDDHAATDFTWEIFLSGGDHASQDALQPRTDGIVHNLSSWVNGLQISSGDRFAMPDNITFDNGGNAWFTTDGTAESFPCNDGIYVVSTTAAAPRQVKRFLTGPIGCEITGPLLSPDNKTFFCGLQHIGDNNGQGSRYRAQRPTPFSTFPNDTWPRDTIVYVRRKDGGIVGG
jgi:hypothetical protein